METKGTQWKRVSGPDLDPENKNRAEANKQVQQDKVFQEACAKVGTEPTRRQASKYRRKKGLAYNGKTMSNM